MKRTRIGETIQYFIGPQGLRRIARARTDVKADAKHHLPEAQELPLRVVEDKDGGVVVVIHGAGDTLSSETYELLYIAQALAGDAPVWLLYIGAAEQHQFTQGADRVLVLNDVAWQQHQPEAKLRLLKTIAQQHTPKHFLFADTVDDNDLARRFACQTHYTFANNLAELSTATTKRLVQACTRQQTLPTPHILCVTAGLSQGALEYRCEAKPWQLDSTVEVDSTQAITKVKHTAMRLEEADFICAAGNGVADVETFHSFANCLGAVVGASRVVVDEGKFDRSQQVGATGVSVQSAVYLAVGISGAIQHLQGIEGCHKVVAINTDPYCPMVKRANFSIIHDAQAVMDAVVQLVDEGEHA